MGIWDISQENNQKEQENQLKSAENLEKVDEKAVKKAPKTQNSAAFPTEIDDHFNRFDLRYDKMLLPQISELEDALANMDVDKMNRKQRLDYGHLVKFLVQNSFYTYFKMSFPASNPLILGKHIRLLCNILTRAERGEFKADDGFTRLIITMPPRHLKSRTISESFPSWFMAKNPNRHTIAVSYSSELGVKFGAKNKEKYESLGADFFGARLSTSTKSKSPWETAEGARFLGTGIGGSVTGFGADLMIIDDPFKNRQEADSSVIRNTIWNEWEDTLKTRLQGEKIIIVIHTRWHDDDLIGRLLKDDVDKNRWLLVNLPAECEDEKVDLLGRKKGQPLWPENGYDEMYFSSIKPQVRTWNALYQQRPQAAGGNMFKTSLMKYFAVKDNFYVLFDGKHIKRFMKHECWTFQTIDTALKETETSDFTAMINFVITPDWDILVYDVFNERLEVPKQPTAIISYRKRWGASFQVVEEKQSGIFLEQTFRNTNTPLRTIGAHKDKIARCLEILTFYESGKVYHYCDMPNLGIFETQLTKFPNAAHDDMVDALAHGGKYISDMCATSGIWAMNNDLGGRRR